jgi:hypothetical protein
LPCKSLLSGLCPASGQKMHDKTFAMRFSGPCVSSGSVTSYSHTPGKAKIWIRTWCWS